MITREYAFALNGSALARGQPLLELVDLGLRFGGVQALDGVGTTITQGSIHALIGVSGIWILRRLPAA